MPYGSEQGASDPFRITHTGPQFWVGPPVLGSSFGPGFGTSGGLGGGWFGLPSFIPEGGWVNEAKIIVANVLDALGRGEYEQGVFDRPEPVLSDVVYGARGPGQLEIPDNGVDWGPGIYEGVSHEPEDWDQVYEDYKILNPEEEDVAHDWGHLGRQVIGGVFGVGQPAAMAAPAAFVESVPTGGITGPAATLQTLGSTPMASNALCPPAGACGGPRYLTYDCKTGQMSVRRRRRKGKLLTNGAKEDLAFILALFGKGAAAQIALAAAVKR